MIDESKIKKVIDYSKIKIELNVAVPMRDGIKLLCDIYRPASEGIYPVLVIRTPYNKTTAQSELAFAHPAWYAAHGYIVVVQDTRGRWGSEGEFYPFAHEAEDGFDTIEFAARITGSTGKVGTFGFSYAGLNQLLTAVLQPPSLAAIAPAFTSSSPYESWSYHQGAPAIGFLSFWAALLGIGDASRKGRFEALQMLTNSMATGSSAWAMRPETDEILTRENVPYYHDWLDHPLYDSYWSRWTLDEDFSRIKVPGLHVLGQWDVFAKGTMRTFDGLRKHSIASSFQKLLMVPFPHSPWSPLDKGVEIGANSVDDCQIRFFNEHLKKEGGEVHDFAVTAYVIGSGWRNLNEWPKQIGRSYFLQSKGRANSAWGDGTLDTEPSELSYSDIFIYDPAQPIISAGGHSTGIEGVQPVGPKDQMTAERSKSVLVFSGVTLDTPLELLGNVIVYLYAATTADDTDFTARLAFVDETGTSRNVLEGIVRASHRANGQNLSSIGEIEIFEYRIELGPIAQIVPAGYKLRVHISSSDFPQWARHLNVSGTNKSSSYQIATQTIYHGADYPSRIELPISY